MLNKIRHVNYTTEGEYPMKNVLYIILLIIILAYIFGSCGGSSSRSSERRHKREVESVRDELYYKGSDGLWYLK